MTLLRCLLYLVFAMRILVGESVAAIAPFEPSMPTSSEECRDFSNRWASAIESAQKQLSECQARDGGTVNPRGVWMPNCKERLQAYMSCVQNEDRLCWMRNSMQSQVSACYSAVGAAKKSQAVKSSPGVRLDHGKSERREVANRDSTENKAAAQLLEFVQRGLIPVELANNCAKILAYAGKNRDLLRGLKTSEEIFGTLGNILKSGAIGNHVLAGDNEKAWGELTTTIVDSSICASRAICPGWMAGRTIGGLLNEASRALSADHRSWNDRITDSAYDKWATWKPRNTNDLNLALNEARIRIQARNAVDYSTHICKDSAK